MAVLRIRYHDQEIELHNDDEALAKLVVMLDESISRRSGIWLNTLLPDSDEEPTLLLTGDHRPNRMVWVPASRIDIEARFDGATPHQARALAVLGNGPPGGTASEITPTVARKA
jgi:hypothetical protein